ncbi:MAG: methyltransferase domain-containing protein [Bacillaceae bacterium]|nr:methyltransferase domain-containing protein [Bacillaceae bacterium]
MEFILKKGLNILDIGCGTGTIMLKIKEKFPDTNVSGLDADWKVLGIARQKAEQRGMEIEFKKGISNDIPYKNTTFDVVVSSLFFHHLTEPNKKRTLKEIYRVLKNEGEIHIADFGKPNNLLMRLCFYTIQMLDGFKTTSDNVKGMIPIYLEDCGFINIKETSKFMTIFGTISVYRAKKPKENI